MIENKKTPSEELMDELEPINNMVDEGGYIHPTQYDESDDLEDAKKVMEDKDMDYSGAFESDIVEAIGLSRERADAKKVMSPIEIKAYENVVSKRWDWYKE